MNTDHDQGVRGRGWGEVSVGVCWVLLILGIFHSPLDGFLRNLFLWGWCVSWLMEGLCWYPLFPPVLLQNFLLCLFLLLPCLCWLLVRFPIQWNSQDTLHSTCYLTKGHGIPLELTCCQLSNETPFLKTVKQGILYVEVKHPILDSFVWLVWLCLSIWTVIVSWLNMGTHVCFFFFSSTIEVFIPNNEASVVCFLGLDILRTFVQRLVWCILLEEQSSIWSDSQCSLTFKQKAKQKVFTSFSPIW